MSFDPKSQQWDDVEAYLDSGVGGHILVFGPPGTGKSYTGKNYALPTNGVVSVTLTPETPAAMLMGFYVVGAGGEFDYRDGYGIRAWRQGCRLVADEIGEVMGDAETYLNALLDDKPTAGETLITGEHVVPADGFNCYATTNVDPKMMSKALVDRFNVVRITDPHPAGIMTLPEDLREYAWHAGTSADVERRISLRAFGRYAAIRDKVPTDQALRLSFGERAEEIRDAMDVGGSVGSSAAGAGSVTHASAAVYPPASV